MKLTKEQRAALERAAADFDAAHGELTEAMANYNDAVTNAYEAVERAGRTYDDKREALQTAASEVADELRDVIGEKSEKWQESDAGQEAEALCTALEEVDAPEFSADEPTELEELDTSSEMLLASVYDAEV